MRCSPHQKELSSNQSASPDIIARDGVVAAHLDDGLRDPLAVPGQLVDREAFVQPLRLLDHLVQGLK